MFGEQNWQQYYPEAASPFDAGLRATSEAVEQVTGLHVDQYAMLNLRGFIQFVNAVGGITVNVRERLPIGGNSEHKVATGWIEPGVQHLDGYYALWYGRSRWSTDDYDRMRRQRCVIAAVVNQADPATVARSFPQIAAAAKDNISTDIPLADLGAWVELTKKVKGAKVRSLPFTSAVVDTVNPDFAETRRLVAEALHPNQVVQPSPTPSVSRRPTQVPSSGPTVPPDSTSAQDINAVC